jgi:hypothetical protein
MKCFHDIKNNIKQRCRQDGANEYQLNYIQPLVEQTRDTVLAQCSLSSPYLEYFLNGAASRLGGLPTGYQHHCCGCPAALLRLPPLASCAFLLSLSAMVVARLLTGGIDNILRPPADGGVVAMLGL